MRSQQFPDRYRCVRPFSSNPRQLCKVDLDLFILEVKRQTFGYNDTQQVTGLVDSPFTVIPTAIPPYRVPCILSIFPLMRAGSWSSTPNIISCYSLSLPCSKPHLPTACMPQPPSPPRSPTSPSISVQHWLLFRCELATHRTLSSAPAPTF